MKKHLVKTLIAAAIASASFAAHAGNVGIYGNVDAGYTHTKDADGVKVHELTSGAKGDSFVGFTGSEMLGGGLKASFVLESGFDLTDGTQEAAGTLFNRNSYLGLSGAFGAVKIGQVSTFSYDLVKKFDAFGGQDWSLAGDGFNTFGHYQADTVAYSNSIGPVNAGVSFKAAGVPGGDIVDGAIISVAAGYDNGPLSVGGVYSTDKTNPVSTAKTLQLGASYEMGFAKAFALYENSKDALSTSDAEDAVLLGLKAPVAAGTTVLFSAGHKEAVDGAEYTLLSVGAQYDLSKRTSLYTSFSKADAKDAGDNTAITAGVAHSF